MKRTRPTRAAESAFADYAKTGQPFMADSVWRDGFLHGFLYGHDTRRDLQNLDGSYPVDWKAGP